MKNTQGVQIQKINDEQDLLDMRGQRKRSDRVKTENKRKRKWQSVAAKQNAQTKMWAALRQVQRDCACTNKTLQYVMQAVFGMEKQKSTFVLDQQYSQVKLLLNGCVGCNQHVYLPNDFEKACPRCRHPRLNEATGKPNEVFK